MPCNKPLLIKNPALKFRNGIETYIKVPCRWCMGCRVMRRKEWSTRMRLEMYDYYLRGFGSSFITLTYDDEHYKGSVFKEDVQKWNKRLRYYIKESKRPVLCASDYKYFLVSEYGDRTERGHYHACYLGIDSVFLKEYARKSWRFGFTSVTPLTSGRINYVLKYLDKQMFGIKDKDFYNVNGYYPPFSLMSKGIGSNYLSRHLTEDTLDYGVQLGGKRFLYNSYYRKKFGIGSQLVQELAQENKEKLARERNMSMREYDVYSRLMSEMIAVKRVRLEGRPCDDSTLKQLFHEYEVLDTSEYKSHSYGLYNLISTLDSNSTLG